MLGAFQYLTRVCLVYPRTLRGIEGDLTYRVSSTLYSRSKQFRNDNQNGFTIHHVRLVADFTLRPCVDPICQMARTYINTP